LKIIVKPFDSKIHNKYISSLKRDIFYIASVTYFIGKKGYYYWLDAEENYHLIRKHVLGKRELLYLALPVITLKGTFNMELTINLLREYNLTIFTEKNAFDYSHFKVATENMTNDVVYRIERGEFFDLRGKKYKRYRSILNKIEKSNSKFTHTTYTFKNINNIPFEAISKLSYTWRAHKKFNFHTLYFIKQLKNNPYSVITIHKKDGVIFAYSILETLNDGYNFIVDRKHILRENYGFKLDGFDSHDINFYIHYIDINYLFKGNSESIIKLNIGGGNKDLMEAKTKLRNYGIQKEQVWVKPKESKCTINFILEEAPQTRNLINLF